MKPLMTDRDCEIFMHCIDNSTVYFEFGTGGSTYQAMLKPNVKHVYSVESDQFWMNKLKSMPFVKNNRHKLSFLFIDMKTSPNNLGYPGSKAKPIDKAKYSRSISSLDSKVISRIDTVLIDGRFRVACALHCFNVLEPDSLVLFDDFVKRKDYHIVLDYYTILEKGDNLVILKKKNVDPPSRSLLSKYELIPF